MEHRPKIRNTHLLAQWGRSFMWSMAYLDLQTMTVSAVFDVSLRAMTVLSMT